MFDVSVIIPTYNHKAFIRKCLDGVLMQKTTYSFEVLIGEDDSKDGTREICIDYEKRYPEKIKLFLNNSKDKLYIDGKPTGRLNVVNLLNNAKGKYIALCEGDDYWIDILKIQKQVDFLEDNPDFSICFHSVKVLDESNTPNIPVLLTQNIKSVTTIEDLCEGNYIYTATCLFRNNLFIKFPDWYYKCTLGDWPLHLLNAMHGKIKFINEPMAIYRQHSGGMWSQLNGIKLELKCITNIKILIKNFDRKYQPYFMKGAVPKYIRLVKYSRTSNFFKAIFYFFQLLTKRKYYPEAISIKGSLCLFLFGRYKSSIS